MPVFNLSVDDASPLWAYGGYWLDTGASAGASTSHTTTQPGASAGITFNGTGAVLFGSQGSDHGTYSVTLDGTTDADGQSQQDVLQAPLFTQTNLPPGTHHVAITDTSTAGPSSSSLDVDYVTLILGDGDANTPITSTTLDDTAANFTYSPGWDSSPNDFSASYLDSTMHRVNTVGASATLSFWGNHVELYGATSYNHGAFSVALDGAPALALNASAPVFRPQTLLYMSSGLPDGPHTLVVASTAPGVFLDMDYAVVRAWSTPPPAASSSARHTISGTAVAGIALGAVIWLALSALALLLVLRRRRRKRPLASDDDSPPPPAYEPRSPQTAVYADPPKLPWALDTEVQAVPHRV